MFFYEISIEDVNLKAIVESGQIFRYYELGEKRYGFMYKEDYVEVVQKENGIAFDCSYEKYLQVWQDFFQLEVDYSGIKKRMRRDSRLSVMVDATPSLRVLKQDVFEMLLTFIISQNKSIPQIQKHVHELSKKYGKKIGNNSVEEVYSFPQAKDLVAVTVDEYKEMKLGYRSSYLYDAVQKVVSGEIDIEQLASKSSSKVIKELLEIKGVGNKVANCVVLFGFGRSDAFPVDRWIKKVILDYFYEDYIAFLEEYKLKNKEENMELFGKTFFGEHAGIVQQYMFEYIRNPKNRKDEEKI